MQFNVLHSILKASGVIFIKAKRYLDQEPILQVKEMDELNVQVACAFDPINPDGGMAYGYVVTFYDDGEDLETMEVKPEDIQMGQEVSVDYVVEDIDMLGGLRCRVSVCDSGDCMATGCAWPSKPIDSKIKVIHQS